MKAFIFDPLWETLITSELLQQLQTADIEPVVIAGGGAISGCAELFQGDEERLLCINPDYVAWKLTNEDYRDIPNLKGVLLASTGYEWVEQDAANRRNIPICHIVNFSTQAVAEWAVMMMFNLARQTPRLIADGFPLDYDKDFLKYRGVQLKGKTVGIIGLGHIGNVIAEACKGLGMNVTYWSRSSTNSEYKRVSLGQVFSGADVIFPTVAKNTKTLDLITDNHIKSIQQSAIVIDIAHKFFNPELMIDMVMNGKLFGYGFEGKPGEFTQYNGNIWAAPAYAWTTRESMYNSVVLWVENMVNASKGEFPNRVN